MAFFSFFGGSSSSSDSGLGELFPISITKLDFTRIDTMIIYKRILNDVLERTEGIPEEKKALLSDNCLASESLEGLVTMIAKAMYEKTRLCLIYDSGLKLIRKADPKEQAEIEQAYKDGKKIDGRLMVNFSKFELSDIMKFYSELEYCNVATLYKNMNVAKSTQVKISELRSSTGLADSAEVKAQAKSIAEAMKKGDDIMIDAKDEIENALPDLTATKTGFEFIAEKRSFYLGYPATYITGVAPAGLGDSGDGDAKAIERGHKGFYLSIVKPIIEAMFSITTSFKSENVDENNSALETLKTFEITGEQYISAKNKLMLINKKFGLPEDAKGDEPKETEIVDNKNPKAPPVPGANPNQKPVPKV